MRELPPKPSKSDSSKAIVIAVVLLASTGVCCSGCCCPAIEARRRSECSNNLKQIALAMLGYNNATGSFPPAYVSDEDGKPLYSWRVLLLPHLEQQSLFDQFDKDKAWDSSENLAVSEMVLEVFRCPSKRQGSGPFTDYVVVVGPETMFPGVEGSRSAQIRDGASNTIMVVEVLDTGVHWAEPRDIAMDDLLAAGINGHDESGCGSHHPGGMNVVNADGSVHFLAEDIADETLRALLTRAGGDFEE